MPRIYAGVVMLYFVAMRMTCFISLLIPLVFCCTAMGQTATPISDDPYLWLEDVTGERALQWVRSQNDRSRKELEASPAFEPIRSRLLAILNSKERIPAVRKYGKFLYNFWRDEKHVRGIWRRTSMEGYRKPEPNWETVLDIDKLAADEKTGWTWDGAIVLKPDYERCLILLSRGGADANVVREFDLLTKDFVAGGFNLPESKCNVDWRNRDTLYVGTDFGPGSMTKSGYPRLVKEWKRGTPLADARTVFEGKEDDVIIATEIHRDRGYLHEMISRRVTFFTNETFIRRGDSWLKIDKPADAQVDTFGEYLLLRLRSDWTVGGKTHAGGSLLAALMEDYLKGDRKLTALFTPGERRSLSSISATKNYLLLNELDNVCGRPYLLKPGDGAWTRTLVPSPAVGTATAEGLDADESDDYFLTLQDFVTPSSLNLGTAGKTERETLKTLPAFFKADGLEARQQEAVSRDGTKVPYFLVSRQKIDLNGTNPTLLYGYGGFEISMLPSYRAAVGAGWLEQGGVYVLANIRGGGEFGPQWHNSARKENRQRAYDDFIAVAEDLIVKKITSPRHLGIQGGSNGGLLVGVMLTQRPDLFGAVVCQAPLLDMRRYNKLLAGASWMDEYGDPDIVQEWAYIQNYSPYQNLAKDKKYPRVLFTTSTRDDRVHPGHARKMAALMEQQGHGMLFYENIEGGHAGADTNEQVAFMNALAYTFLLKELR